MESKKKWHAFSVADPDPGSGMDKNQDPDGIRDEHPRSYLRELKNNFWCGSGIFLTLDLESGMEKF